jgi:hypothetical protein
MRKVAPVFAAATVFAATSFVTAVHAQVAADWEWMDHEYPKALAELMPIQVSLGGFIGFRSHRDLHYEEPEFSLVLTDRRELGLQATIREPDGPSIYQQLLTVRLAAPSTTGTEALKTVKVKTTTLNAKTCPAIAEAWQSFANICFRPSAIVLHPMVFEFASNYLGGDLSIELTDEEEPLVQWALHLKKQVRACLNAP